MEHIFIINPKSGNQQGASCIPLIHEYFKTHSDPYTVLLTEYPMHAAELAAQYTNPDTVIYCLSGDGTANEVLNGLHPDVSLSVLPFGSGNDYFRMLDLPKMDAASLIRESIEGKTCLVDYGISGGRRFLNCSSMGFDADVGIMAHEIKVKRPYISKLSYMLAAFKILAKRETMMIELDFGDSKIQGDFLILAVMNGRYYGNGFTPTPKATIQDGYLDICLVENTNILNILRLIPLYMMGKHTKEKIVSFYKVKTLKLHAQRSVATQFDGEVIYRTDSEFSLVEKGLKLRVPKSSSLKETD